MLSRHAWLEEGLRLVAECGIDALRIERLCADLGVSKGSFYHHFADGMPGFRRELLAHYEQQYTLRYIDAVEAGGSELPAADRIQRLRRLVIDDESEQPRLEAGIRAWAGQDDEARSTLERVDATRIGFLRALWQEISGDEAEATSMARLLYVVLIGSQHILPQLAPDEIDQLYEVILAPALKDRA